MSKKSQSICMMGQLHTSWRAKSSDRTSLKPLIVSSGRLDVMHQKKSYLP